MSEHRCGVVALLGRPNAGKSTLLNRIVGEKLAITAERAQTTRACTLGVLNRPGAQLIFCDTPGLNRGRARFNRALSELALERARNADLSLLLVDAAAQWDAPEEAAATVPGPLMLVRTKVDLARPGEVPGLERFVAVSEVSARTGAGIEALIERIIQQLPVSPPLYPEDYLTDVSQRFLASEQIREVAIELYRDEIPYALAIEVEEWRESSGEIRIRANLLVEHESQKGIVVGAGGRMLRDLGVEARRRLAELFGCKVHLNLWVKADRNWSKRPKRARELGYL